MDALTAAPVIEREQRKKYLGETERFLSLEEMVLYLGYYCEYHKSYKEVEREVYHELFGLGKK